MRRAACKHDANTEALRDYLRGYLRSPINREVIASRQDWQQLAQAELDRRAAAAIAILPDDELRMIADGVVDLPRLAQEMMSQS